MALMLRFMFWCVEFAPFYRVLSLLSLFVIQQESCVLNVFALITKGTKKMLFSR